MRLSQIFHNNDSDLVDGSHNAADLEQPPSMSPQSPHRGTPVEHEKDDIDHEDDARDQHRQNRGLQK